MTEQKNALDDFPQSWDVVDFENDKFQNLKRRQKRPEFLVYFFMKHLRLKKELYARLIVLLLTACVGGIAFLLWPKEEDETLIKRESTPQELRIQELIKQSRPKK